MRLERIRAQPCGEGPAARGVYLERPTADEQDEGEEPYTAGASCCDSWKARSWPGTGCAGRSWRTGR